MFVVLLQGYKAYIDDGSVPAQNVEEARKLKDSLGQELLGKVFPSQDVAGPLTENHQRLELRAPVRRIFRSGACLIT